MYGSQWGSLHAVYKKPYFLLQFMRESVSGTCAYIRTCNEMKGSYDKIIITRVLSYTRKKNFTRLLPLALLLMLCTGNNTDGNKFVIFSGIAWYYGDTYLYNN